MKGRCYIKSYASYKHYGGRGISVCEEWKNDFMAFYNWATENGYEDTLTIDRIDINGNYCPENCRWVDQKTQSRNRRTNVFLTDNGITRTVAEWAEITGQTDNRLRARIRNGWSDHEVIFGKEVDIIGRKIKRDGHDFVIGRSD